jgi:hypothetical protein
LSALDGSCEVGFFKNDVPWGKYLKFRLDGTYELAEGLYEGPNNLKTKIIIANF